MSRLYRTIGGMWPVCGREKDVPIPYNIVGSLQNFHILADMA